MERERCIQSMYCVNMMSKCIDSIVPFNMRIEFMFAEKREKGWMGVAQFCSFLLLDFRVAYNEL